MLTDIYIANAVTPCDCTEINRPIEMRTTEGLQESGYPITVYDVNLEVIGVANDKAEYMSIWNAAASNLVVGYLSGHSAPFYFTFHLTGGPRPTFVYGNPINEAGDSGNIIQEDELDIIQESGEVLIVE